MQNIQRLNGKAAVFARAFMEAFPLDGKLRSCQDAGAKAVRERDDEISIPYISRLCRDMRADDLFTMTKKGRSYLVRAAGNTHSFKAWLDENPEWGVEVDSAEASDIDARASMIEFLDEYQAIRINASRPLNKAAYKLLIDRFKAGKMDMVFVPVPGMVEYPQGYAIEEFDE